jgi:hypothetical protein
MKPLQTENSEMHNQPLATAIFLVQLVELPTTSQQLNPNTDIKTDAFCRTRW